MKMEIISILRNRFYYTTRKRQFVYHNCFLYDIRQCSFRIIRNLGYTELYDQLIKIEDKQERVKQLGIELSKNKKLLSLVNDITISIIRRFIIENDIKDDEILLIQKDGILCTKYIDINITENEIYPELRHVFEYVIFSADKKQMLFKEDITQKIITKGITHKSIGLDSFLTEQLYNTNLTNFKQFNNLIYNFFMSNKLELFLIEKNKDTYFMFLKDGILELQKDIIESVDIDIEDIDKHYYFTLYLENLLRGILIQGV